MNEMFDQPSSPEKEHVDDSIKESLAQLFAPELLEHNMFYYPGLFCHIDKVGDQVYWVLFSSQGKTLEIRRSETILRIGYGIGNKDIMCKYVTLRWQRNLFEIMTQRMDEICADL